MNITSYIVEFLKKGNDVEISGLGTLRVKSIAAQYQQETGTYTPAIRTIEFVREFTENKKIVDYIAEKECVPRDTAQKMWHNFVVALKEKLQNEGEHELENLGVIKHNSIGETKFIANPKINLLENTFGFQSITDVKQYTVEPLKINPFDYSGSSIGINVVPENEWSAISIKDSSKESAIEKRLKEIVAQLDEDDKVEEAIKADAKVEVISEEKLSEKEIERVLNEANEIEKDVIEDVSEELGTVSEETKDIVKEVFSKVDVEEFVEEEKKQIHQPEVSIEKEKSEIRGTESLKEATPKKKKSKTWFYVLVVLLCLVILGAGIYHYYTHIRIESPTVPAVQQTIETENIQPEFYQGEYNPNQFLMKETADLLEAEKLIRENEGLYVNGGIFAMKPMEEELMDQYYLNNLSLIKPVEVPQVKKPQVVEKKPARRKIHIPVKSKSDYEFDLVAGIFKIKANAIKLADDIAQYGINPYIIEVPKNGSIFYYVSLGGRRTYTEIEALMANYRHMRGVDMAITKW